MVYLIFLLLINQLQQNIGDKCDFFDLAETLRNRIFPPTVLNPLDIHPLPPLPNSNCEIILTMPDTYTITGTKCYLVPQNNSVPNTNIAISSTKIVKITEGAFKSWCNTESMQITLNSELDEIIPGSFEGLYNLWNLSISDNMKLSYLHPESFRGLVNLKELRLLRNSFASIIDISGALSTSQLPNVTYLDVSGNSIPLVGAKDFYPMNGSKLNTLVMSMTKTSFMDKSSLNPLSSLVELKIGENMFNSSVAAALIDTLKAIDPELRAVSLEQNLMYFQSQVIFKSIADSNITNFDIKKNHFGVVYPGFFPKMPNLKLLDMASVLIDNIPDGVISNTIMPKLERLFLGGNSFPGISRSMAVNTLLQLDLSDNTKDLSWNTQFNIPIGIFSLMPQLQILDLSGNQLNKLSQGVFSNASNLKILYLHSSNLHKVDDFVFDHNNKLFYLDLSNNDFPSVYNFTKNIFRGLTNLRALDLSFCSISTFASPDIFYYLKKLQYLSLRGNSLIEVDGAFDFSHCLKELDLRSNIITSWQKRLFGNNANLTTLLLDKNQISTISLTMLQDFSSIKRLSMYQDPINCNCDFVNNVRRYLKINNILLWDLPLGETMNFCFSPTNIRHVTLKSYLQDQVHSQNCLGINYALISSVAIVGVLLSICIAFAIWYNWSYHLKYWYYVLKEKLGLLNFPGIKKRMHGDPNYKYDAFVSYSHEDRNFVKKMVNILEEGSRFKLCVFERDFNIGDLISESVMESVASSRVTIMVLTNAFLKSHWCLWEMQIAHQRSMFFRRAEPDSLVIIKLSDVDEEYLTTTLKHLMKTRIYLKWDKNVNKQKLFWQQLKAAIRKQK